MPKEYKKKSRRFASNKLLGTKYKFMSEKMKIARSLGLSGDIRYFVSSGRLNITTPGHKTHGLWSPMRESGTLDVWMPSFATLGDMENYCTFWCRYKILSFEVVIYASNINTEAPVLTNLGWQRGNTVMYTIAQQSTNQQYDSEIQDVITRGSAKMIPSRIERWKTTMYRPKGYTAYGVCDDTVVGPVGTNPWTFKRPDAWRGAIVLLGNDAFAQPVPVLPQTRPMWYWKMTTKVAFSGRKLGGPIV